MNNHTDTFYYAEVKFHELGFERTHQGPPTEFWAKALNDQGAEIIVTGEKEFSMPTEGSDFYLTLYASEGHPTTTVKLNWQQHQALGQDIMTSVAIQVNAMRNMI